MFLQLFNFFSNTTLFLPTPTQLSCPAPKLKVTAAHLIFPLQKMENNNFNAPKGVPVPAHDLLSASGKHDQDGFTTYYGANPPPGWSQCKTRVIFACKLFFYCVGASQTSQIFK